MMIAQEFIYESVWCVVVFFFFSSRRRHTRCSRDWSSDVCSSDLPLHGFGIGRRLEQLSEEVLQLNEGTVYTSLLRLQQEGWIVSDWGTSENNRKADRKSVV